MVFGYEGLTPILKVVESGGKSLSQKACLSVSTVSTYVICCVPHIYAVLISEAQTSSMDAEIVNRIETVVMHPLLTE